MRVLHWYPNFLSGGGVANATLGLANAQAQAGADVWVATATTEATLYGALAPRSGVEVFVWRATANVGRASVRFRVIDRRTRSALRAIRPEIVHIHGEYNPDNWWPPRLFECPLILSPHGAFHSVVRAHRRGAKSVYMRVAQTLLYRRLARIHALSPAEMSDSRAAIALAHVYCVPQGPSPTVEAFAAHHGRPSAPALSEGPVRFLFLGRLAVRTKGLDTLLRGFALALRERRSGRAARLTLVGPDWNGGKAVLTALASELGIAEYVDIMDAVDAQAVPAVLCECDVYVQVSRHEGFPLSLNDALFLGKPAIISDQVGTLSYAAIRDEPHVTVVRPEAPDIADAVASAIGRVDALVAEADEARPRVMAFLSWERIAAEHLAEYERARQQVGAPGDFETN